MMELPAVLRPTAGLVTLPLATTGVRVELLGTLVDGGAPETIMKDRSKFVTDFFEVTSLKQLIDINIEKYRRSPEEVRHGDSLELQSIHSNHVKLEVINNKKTIWNVLIEPSFGYSISFNAGALPLCTVLTDTCI